MRPSSFVSVVVLLIVVCATPSASSTRSSAETVSPGSAREVTVIDQRCPSFSWGAEEGARGYELTVFRLQEGVEASLLSAEPVLRERLPGGASSWTPSLARCLAPGGRYAWLVRSLGEEGASDWSEPRLFEVAAGSLATEVEHALAVLQAYLAAGGVELEKGSGAQTQAAGPEAGERREAWRVPLGAGLESPGGPEGVLVPDVTAVRGRVPDPAGVTFGLHGISASTDADSAGVVGESTATSGATFGVLGEVDSAAGVAGAFDNTAGGQILSGRNNAVEVFSVDGAGDVTVSGVVDGVDVGAHAADANAHHTPPTTLPPSGPAGGDLSGTFPDPDVVDDSHAHTGATVPDLWVDEVGDTMTGTLTLTPGAGNALEANASINLASGNVLKGGTLFLHDNGLNNTALGSLALSSNSTGFSNTASGFKALYSNSTGRSNTAAGDRALYANTTGSYNTASGYGALRANTTGFQNTASGFKALRDNITGYRNTASGFRALYANTTGAYNTASGNIALRDNTTGAHNTASGARALQANTTGSRNTASGARALLVNTTGSLNTASGAHALQANTTGYRNTGCGWNALQANTTGFRNTATGNSVLESNTTGAANTATGNYALLRNTTGSNNTASGSEALESNTTGFLNTASGVQALTANTTGQYNTATGSFALFASTTGSRNTAVGIRAGRNATTGSDNIFLGSGAYGVAGEGYTIRIGGTTGAGAGQQNRTFIAGIRGITTGVSDAVTVLIDSAGQLGTVSSSQRFKKEIEDMGEASDKLLELRPVTFKYKQEPVAGEQPRQFGLIAEEVAEVFPDLVVRDEEGRPSTVRYHLLSSMLLNELQKQQEQLDNQKEQLEAQDQLRRELLHLKARLEAVEARRVLLAEGPTRPN